jgi:hypothetical protein
LQEGQLQIADFGLIDLLWVPGGQLPSVLKGRYTAPELANHEPSGGADVYSLAMIYAELLTGAHPLQGRGRQRRRTARGHEELCLDKVPGLERPILARALSPQPNDRFATCLEFIEALEAAASDCGARKELDRNLAEGPQTPVPAAENADGLILPSGPGSSGVPVLAPPGTPASLSAAQVQEIVSQLATAVVGSAQVHQCEHFRYVLDPGKVLSCNCGAWLPPEVAQAKLEELRKEWHLQVLERSENSFRFFGPTSPSLLQRVLGKQPGLEVQIDLVQPQSYAMTLTGVNIQFKPMRCGRRQGANLLTELAPLLLEDIRICLQAWSERRGLERLPCSEHLQVWPIQANQRLVSQPIDGRGKDITERGIGLFLPELPETSEILVDLSPLVKISPANVLAHIVRVREHANDLYEVGAVFCHDKQLPQDR